MARVRTASTAPEVLLRRALWTRGLRCRLRVKLPGSPDMVFLGARLAVFVDGCFWHGCPEHYKLPGTNSEFWSAKLKENRSRDRRVDDRLAELGWTVMRIWEHEVISDVAEVADRIEDLVRR